MNTRKFSLEGAVTAGFVATDEDAVAGMTAVVPDDEEEEVDNEK